MNSENSSKLRQGAFAESIWQDHISHLIDYPGVELGEKSEGKVEIIKTINALARLKFFSNPTNSLFLNDLGILELQDSSNQFIIRAAADHCPSLFYFQVVIAEMGFENRLDELGQTVNIDPWLYGNPISLSHHMEPNGTIGEEVTYELLGFSSEIEQFLVQTTFFYLHLTLGLAVLKIGYENFVNSLDDLVPVCNDIWQKYLGMLEQFVLEELD